MTGTPRTSLLAVVLLAGAAPGVLKGMTLAVFKLDRKGPSSEPLMTAAKQALDA